MDLDSGVASGVVSPIHPVLNEDKTSLKADSVDDKQVPAEEYHPVPTKARWRPGIKFQHASSLSTKGKFTVGIVIVVAIAVSWVGSTQTAKSTYGGGFAAPYFLVWFGTAWMMTVFPLTAPIYFITRQGRLGRQGLRQLWE